MFNLIAVILTFAGLGGIVFIFVKRWEQFKNAPVQEEKIKTIEGAENLLRNLKTSLDSGSQKLESKFSNFSEKSLRKIKVLVLRIDAFISKKLENLRADKNKVFKESIFDSIDKEKIELPENKPQDVVDIKEIAERDKSWEIGKKGNKLG